MNLAYHNRTSQRIPEQPVPVIESGELDAMASLVNRFNEAHLRLNEVELALHDSLDSPQRMTMLHRLEDARGAYMDARFAMIQQKYDRQ